MKQELKGLDYWKAILARQLMFWASRVSPMVFIATCLDIHDKYIESLDFDEQKDD